MKKEFFPPIVIMLFGAYIFMASSNLQPSMYQSLGASAYSKIIVTLLWIIGVICLWDMRRKPSQKESGGGNEANNRDSRIQMIMFVVLIIFYILGFQWLGFFSSSFVFITLCIFLLAGQHINELIRGAIIALVVVGLVYVCFKVFLNLYFPEALLF